MRKTISQTLCLGALLNSGRLQFLNTLRITWCRKLTAVDFENLHSSCKYIQRLDVSFSKLTKSSVRYIAAFPELSHLKLKGCDGLMKPSVMCPLLERLGKRLIELDLGQNDMRGTNTLFQALMDNCPYLALLDFSKCLHLTDGSYIDIERLQRCCPRLRIIRLASSDLRAIYRPFDENETMGFPDLEILDVGVEWPLVFCNRRAASTFTINDNYLLRMLRNSPKLSELNLRLCWGISDKSLARIHVKNLKTLNILGCDVFCGLPKFMRKWVHSMETLTMCKHDPYSDEILEAFKENFSALTQGTGTIDVCGTPVPRDRFLQISQNAINKVNYIRFD